MQLGSNCDRANRGQFPNGERYRLVDLDDSVPYGIKRKVSDRVQIELPHEVGAVSLRGLNAEAESGSDLLSSLTLRDQLNYLPFPRGQHILAGRVTFFMRAQVAIEKKVTLPAKMC